MVVVLSGFGFLWCETLGGEILVGQLVMDSQTGAE